MVVAKATDNNIQNTRSKIITEASKLFSDSSFLDVSMNDIAKRLNITKPALYYHFASKDDLYIEVLDGVFERLNLTISDALLEKLPEHRLKKLIENYLNSGLTEKNIVQALISSFSPDAKNIRNKVVHFRGRLASLTTTLIDEIKTGRDLSKKLDSRVLATILFSMMDGLIIEYSLLGKKFDTEKVSEQILAVLL